MTIGVLLMAYGTPASPEDVERYYTDIRRGRRPTPAQLDDLRGRYDAIGGVSPLRAGTESQAQAVAKGLGPGFLVALGMKHSAPSIEAAVDDLERAHVEAIVAVVLAPHYSPRSVGEYTERAHTACRRARFLAVESWHRHPLLVETLADRVADETAWLPDGAMVAFTAHSLPARIVDDGDPYPAQVTETASAVAEMLGLDARDWLVAWQSAGRTAEAWLGPDIVEVIRLQDDRRSMVVCPVGFVSDHLETLYDLDVEAARAARRRRIPFSRTRALGVDVAPIVIDIVLSTAAIYVRTMSA